MMSHGRNAVITGGGAGIGRAISVALAQAGHHVCIIDLDEAAASETARLITAAGGGATTLIGSVQDYADVVAMFDRIQRETGRIDVLVNNAGVSGNKPTLELTEAEWNKTIGVNQTAVFFCSQQAARVMLSNGGGSIVNIGSVYSLVAAPNRLPYCASKAAVAMMTKSMAIEWAEHGIRVNCVAPGYVETALVHKLQDEGRLNLEAIRARTPQKRLATPDDIARAVLGFCDPLNAHITGQVLAVDGGWTAYGYI